MSESRQIIVYVHVTISVYNSQDTVYIFNITISLLSQSIITNLQLLSPIDPYRQFLFFSSSQWKWQFKAGFYSSLKKWDLNLSRQKAASGRLLGPDLNFRLSLSNNSGWLLCSLAGVCVCEFLHRIFRSFVLLAKWVTSRYREKTMFLCWALFELIYLFI